MLVVVGWNRGMRVERLLVVVAHPDDETFGCGSFLAHAAECGVDITVACATRGEAGEPAEGTLCAASVDDVAVAIVSLIDEIEPTVVPTLAASDGHRDHVNMREATLTAVDRATWATPSEDVTTVIDTTDLLDRREAAIVLHRSQTSPYEVMPQDLRNDFLTAERLRRVRPPWDGGDVETEVFGAAAVFSPRDAPAAPTHG